MTAPSDEVRAEEVARHLKAHPGVIIDMDAWTALTIAGLLQLACKHPSVGEDMAETARLLVDHIAEGLGPPIMAMIEEGWGR